jgi:hypothetical protein
MTTVLVPAALLLWVLGSLPLAVAVGRAFDAGSDGLVGEVDLRSAAAGRDAA